jgi:hypothetical protein
MVVRYPSQVFHRELRVQRRILLSGLAVAAFAVTFAFTFRRPAGLPVSGALQPAKAAVPAPSVASPADGPPAAAPMPPAAVAAPPTAAPNPPPAAAASEASRTESLYDQNINPGVDVEAMRRDRGVQHSTPPH